MKIKVEHLTETERCTLSIALDYYMCKVGNVDPECGRKYAKIASKLRHGELLLCEYVDNQEEE